MAWYWIVIITVLLVYIYISAAIALVSLMIKEEPFLEHIGLLKIVVLGLIWPLTLIGMFVFIQAMKLNGKEVNNENHGEKHSHPTSSED